MSPQKSREKPRQKFKKASQISEQIASLNFAEYYQNIFGTRWPSLRRALCTAGPRINLRQLYGLLGDYWLDPASHFLAELLVQQLRYIISEQPNIQVGLGFACDNLQVWDMCAAPGGKLLCLALCLPAAARLYASEVSGPRFARLQQQLSLLPATLHTPPKPELRRADACLLAQRYCRQGTPARLFDAILLDAPCSSERHLLRQAESRPKQLQEWRVGRSKRNAQKQLALLCSALDCLAPGGKLLYATCALSPLENAAVVEKALNKRANLPLVPVQLRPELYPWQLEPQFGDRASLVSHSSDSKILGYSILPDRNAGSGPLYFCLLQKN